MCGCARQEEGPGLGVEEAAAASSSAHSGSWPRPGGTVFVPADRSAARPPITVSANRLAQGLPPAHTHHV